MPIILPFRWLPLDYCYGFFQRIQLFCSFSRWQTRCFSILRFFRSWEWERRKFFAIDGFLIFGRLFSLCSATSLSLKEDFSADGKSNLKQILLGEEHPPLCSRCFRLALKSSLFLLFYAKSEFLFLREANLSSKMFLFLYKFSLPLSHCEILSPFLIRKMALLAFFGEIQRIWFKSYCSPILCN